ncbi:MAG: exostosin domain-containing protein [Methylobacter sp.]
MINTRLDPATALFEFKKRFTIQKIVSHDGERLRFFDCLSRRSEITAAATDFSLENTDTRRAALRMFMPMCIGHSPLPVRDKPGSIEDSHFWQFPAITELLAFQSHKVLQAPEWNPCIARINTYLGLPWASYIDKQTVPDVVRQVFGVRLRGYHALADEWGLQWGQEVAVHTVCQHIYWIRMLPFWKELGVTDVHLSHCEPESAKVADQHNIRVHSWPLAAANVVNPDRREGLFVGKFPAERPLLASFIGAYMPHYRSDVRLRLRDEAVNDGMPDVVFDLNNDWHFNPMVYQAQVAGEALSPGQIAAERAATVHYNELLSDSVFSLCPEGAGPNTLRLWESLAVGAIPVVIVDDWIWPSVPGTGLNWQDAVIHVHREDMAGLFDRLRQMRVMESHRLKMMQKTGMQLYERFAAMRCFF